eukprot:7696391-Pyramimonas_sp.AAC.1
MGHPEVRKFCRVLRAGGVKPHLVRWVRNHFRCSECEEKRRSGTSWGSICSTSTLRGPLIPSPTWLTTVRTCKCVRGSLTLERPPCGRLSWRAG